MTLPGEVGRVRVGGSSGYSVVVGRGLLAALPDVVDDVLAEGTVAVVSDSNVLPLHGKAVADALRAAGRKTSEHAFPAGEASKTRKRWSILTDELLDAGHGRDVCVIAVGGGVTTDLAGFVAATYLRGVPVVLVPTSTLAMVDASTGGKTGVDVRAGKNLVGAFHRPAAVIADIDPLRTLPREERAQGLVEAVKHAAILDASHLDAVDGAVESLLDADPGPSAEIVLASVALKAAVVDADELEAGYRQVLNFGHTIGHAVEAAAGYRLGHGSCVAFGMRVEAAIGERLGVTEPGTGARVERVLERLVGAFRPGVGVDEVRAYLGADKKARAGRARYVLLERPGRVAAQGGWAHDVADEVVAAELDAALES